MRRRHEPCYAVRTRNRRCGPMVAPGESGVSSSSFPFATCAANVALFFFSFFQPWETPVLKTIPNRMQRRNRVVLTLSATRLTCFPIPGPYLDYRNDCELVRSNSSTRCLHFIIWRRRRFSRNASGVERHDAQSPRVLGPGARRSGAGLSREAVYTPSLVSKGGRMQACVGCLEAVPE